MAQADSSLIELNVSGVHYTATAKTLKSQPTSLLAKWITPGTPESAALPKDSKVRHFVFCFLPPLAPRLCVYSNHSLLLSSRLLSPAHPDCINGHVYCVLLSFAYPSVSYVQCHLHLPVMMASDCRPSRANVNGYTG